MKIIAIIIAGFLIVSCQTSSPKYQFTNEEITGGRGKLFVARAIVVEDDGDLRFVGTPAAGIGTRIKKRDNVTRIKPQNILTISPTHIVKSLNSKINYSTYASRCSITHNARGMPIMIQIELQNCQSVVQHIIEAMNKIGYKKINENQVLIEGHICMNPNRLNNDNINKNGIMLEPFCRPKQG